MLKVHFAGAEQFTYAQIYREAGVRYALFTVFNFICADFGIKGTPQQPRVDHIFPPAFVESRFRHSIMDSGLFTLMFGAHAGKRDRRFIGAWFERLVDFVRTNRLKSAIVEVDCQKVLGTAEAWRLRERLRDALPNNRTINVFHVEDGHKGLDRLIEFSEYLAISVPELRICRPKTFAQDVERLARYVKTRKPEIDLHLLGCTQKNILRSCRDLATSADSTSHQSATRYGQCLGRRTNSLKPSERARLVRESRPFLERLEREFRRPVSPNFKRWVVEALLATRLHKRLYESLAGNQE